MEITGKIIQVLPLQEGEGKNGAWKKQDFILETQEQYPKKVCISVWGNKIDQFNIVEGVDVKASINVESREYNEKWYTDVKAWRLQEAGAVSSPSEEGGNTFMAPPPTPADAQKSTVEEIEDDLPF